jgi:hypothetical protein
MAKFKVLVHQYVEQITSIEVDDPSVTTPAEAAQFVNDNWYGPGQLYKKMGDWYEGDDCYGEEAIAVYAEDATDDDRPLWEL